MNYILHLAILIGIYLIIVYAFNLTFGFCGLFNLSSGAFYGFGAYAFALLRLKMGVDFFPALALTMIITGAVSVAVGFPSLKFRKDSFTLVTLGLQVMFFHAVNNWISLTGGLHGLPGIPRPSFFGWRIENPSGYFLLVLVADVLILSLLFYFYRLPFGNSLRALRDDERGAMALGKSPRAQFLWAFSLGNAAISVAGALFASYLTYIDPSSFNLDESFYHVVILSIGGSGNRKGPLVGLLFMMLIPEFIRTIGIADSVVFNLRQILFGTLLVAMMILRPRGLAGEYVRK